MISLKTYDENRIRYIKDFLLKEKIVIVICGPTAIGKTSVSINLAELFKSHIISFDSMQVYKGLDIGTDKYKENNLKGIKHHMIDVFEPDQDISVIDFRELCRKKIEDFFHQGIIPILVGGSGLYLRSIIDNIDFTGNEAILEEGLREKIESEFNHLGPEKTYSKLKNIDPEYSKKISPNDKKRIIRALEVYYSTGRPFSSFHIDIKKRKSIYNTIQIGLSADRKHLYDKIEDRVDLMLEKGFLDEVKSLVAKGFQDSNCMKQAVGYKELLGFLNGNIKSLEEAVKLIKRNTRRLAKKQFTWFKEDKRINWIRVDEYDNILDLVRAIINTIESKLRR